MIIMKNSKKWFTLVEIIITLFITSILLIIIINVYPNLISTFTKQKQNLLFQQSAILDNFYLNKKITNSNRVFSEYSTGQLWRYNSKLLFLNKPWNLHYSNIYLWNDNWKIISNAQRQDAKAIVKNDLFYSSFVTVWQDIYFTNPWNHTINKILSWSVVSTVVYWISWTKWYSNTLSWIFSMPTWLAINWNTLYVADTWNSLVRKIDLTSWIISDLAWIKWQSGYNDLETDILWTNNSSVLFDNPTSLVYYSWSIFVSDTYNNRVRKIDLSLWKTFSIIWSDNFWFNSDNLDNKQVLINYPLSIDAVSNWIIFWDVLNWKIRYYNDLTKEVKTLVWIESLWNLSKNIISKYNKNYYNSYIQSYLTGFYFNDLYNSIIYNYTFWDWIIWNSDDKIELFLWNNSSNILNNWDVENDISVLNSNNDLSISDNEIFSKVVGNYVYPISWENYLQAQTFWKYAKWEINFSWNPVDWNKIQYNDKIFEFDDWTLTYDIWNIVIPIWINLDETITNVLTEFKNYKIKSTREWNKIKIVYSDSWNIWNNCVFTWTWINFTFSPSSWKLTWWITLNTGYYSFNFTKNLIQNEKYKLSFYYSSDTNTFWDILNPLLIVNTWTWNVETKIVNSTSKWQKVDIIFNWLWNNQVINFSVKNSLKLNLDNISLVPISNWQNIDISKYDKIKFLNLQSFFVINNNKILLSDFYNKKLYYISFWILNTVISDLYLFDLDSLSLNLKNDYISNSVIDKLAFEIINNWIIYYLWKWDFSLKITNNIK